MAKVLKADGLARFWANCKAFFVKKTGDTMTGTLVINQAATNDSVGGRLDIAPDGFVEDTTYYTRVEKNYMFDGVSAEHTAMMALIKTTDDIETESGSEVQNYIALTPTKTVLKQNLSIGSGGTGASTAAQARTNLGLGYSAITLSPASGVTASAYVDKGVVVVKFTFTPVSGWTTKDVGIPSAYRPRSDMQCAFRASGSGDITKGFGVTLSTNGQFTAVAGSAFSNAVDCVCVYPMKS